MKKIIVSIFLLLIIWFFSHTLVITIDGLSDEINQVDVGVVLGNKVELNGEPSTRLQSRLNKAVYLYNSSYINYVIVSGGVGKEGFDEALVMQDYLVSSGIPLEKIMIDSNGVNTLMTAKNTREIMDLMDIDTVIVISQFHHISRTKLAFKKVGFEKVYSAHADYFELRDLYSITREFFAYYKYLLQYSIG